MSNGEYKAWLKRRARAEKAKVDFDGGKRALPFAVVARPKRKNIVVDAGPKTKAQMRAAIEALRMRLEDVEARCREYAERYLQ